MLFIGWKEQGVAVAVDDDDDADGDDEEEEEQQQEYVMQEDWMREKMNWYTEHIFAFAWAKQTKWPRIDQCVQCPFICVGRFKCAYLYNSAQPNNQTKPN